MVHHSRKNTKALSVLYYCRKYFGGMKTKRNCGMTSNKSGIIKAMNN
jgi:hypothetical protein